MNITFFFFIIATEFLTIFPFNTFFEKSNILRNNPEDGFGRHDYFRAKGVSTKIYITFIPLLSYFFKKGHTI